MSEVFDKAVKEAGLASLGEAEPDLHPLPQSKLSISKKVPRSSELYEGISGVYPPERVIPPGYINPLDYVEHPDQIPEFIKSLREEERTSQRNPEGLTATEQMHRRFPSIDPSIKKRSILFPHPKGSFKEGLDITDWQAPELLIDFLKLLSHEEGKYPFEAGAKDPEGIQAIETFKGILGPTGASLLKGAMAKTVDPTVMRMMVGEDAKLPKKVMKDLDRAKRLDKNGRDRNYVYDQTGWSRESNVIRPGSDKNVGKWMFEISDSKAYIKQNIDYNKANLVLEDILHHPELFKVSPELKKHPISIADAHKMRSSAGSYAGAGTESGLVPGTIHIKPFLDHTIRTRLEDMDSFLHPEYGKYGNKKNRDLIDKIEYPGRSKNAMKALLESYGYRTKKEVQSIPNKHIENIFEKEMVRDYKKLKEAYPKYMTNIDWLKNQRKGGGIPDINEFNHLLNPDNIKELMQARGTRGIYEPDYVLVPDKKLSRKMYRENANQELMDELSAFTHWRSRDHSEGIKEHIQRGGSLTDRFRDRSSLAPGGEAPYRAALTPGLSKEMDKIGWPHSPHSRSRATLREEGRPRYHGKSEEALETALHETQHAAQHRYDFTPGVSWTSSQIKSWKRTLNDIRKKLNKVGAKIELKKQRGLFRTPGGLPTIKPHKAIDSPFPQRTTEENFYFPTKIKHKGKEYELEKGSTHWADLPSEIRKAISINNFFDLRRGGELGFERKTFSKDIKEGRRKEYIPRVTMSNKEQYLHDRGEAWARNTERRKQLEKQTFPRKDKTVPRPWETLDVREDLLWDSSKWDKDYWPYPFMPKKKTGGGLSGLGEK
jgi:hypothetical protein